MCRGKMEFHTCAMRGKEDRIIPFDGDVCQPIYCCALCLEGGMGRADDKVLQFLQSVVLFVCVPEKENQPFTRLISRGLPEEVGAASEPAIGGVCYSLAKKETDIAAVDTKPATTKKHRDLRPNTTGSPGSRLATSASGP